MKYFNSPFAASGDKIDIPNANQADGSVSFVQGFGFDYERENTDPNYKPVPREQTNALYHDITEALQYVQTGRVFPYNQDFANAIGGYKKGSLVSIDSDLSVVYKSKVDSNLSPPPSANWEVAGEVAQATEATAGVAKIATQEKTNSGDDDSDFVTPKKLRYGFAIILQATGYIAFPTWMGGLIIQWGRAARSTAGAISVVFPVAYTSSKFMEVALPILGSPVGWDVCQSNGTTGLSGANFSRRSGNGSTTNADSNFDIYWLSIGR